MVSIRRRKLLATCSGQNPFFDPLSDQKNAKDVGVCALPLNGIYKPKQETALETVSGSSPLKEEDHVQKFPEVKRRKRHRRKQVENQEQCVMRGVYFKNLKWQAAIKVDKKQIHLGTVSSQEEAARLYDRAAFMCGREPNFELSQEEKQELRKFKWEEFLAMTRSAITNKKIQRRTRRKVDDNKWEVEQGRDVVLVSEDEVSALSP